MKTVNIASCNKGAFTNYVYKRRGVGGQKKPNFVNVVCERPLSWLGLLLVLFQEMGE